jgi:hypothetical protein
MLAFISDLEKAIIKAPPPVPMRTEDFSCRS